MSQVLFAAEESTSASYIIQATEGDRTEVSGEMKNSPTIAEVVAAIENGKAAGADEIRPEILKSFGEEGV